MHVFTSYLIKESWTNVMLSWKMAPIGVISLTRRSFAFLSCWSDCYESFHQNGRRVAATDQCRSIFRCSAKWISFWKNCSTNERERIYRGYTFRFCTFKPFWVSLWKVGIRNKTFIIPDVMQHKEMMTFFFFFYRCTDLNYNSNKQNRSEELISDLLYCSCMPHPDRREMCFHPCKTLATSVPDSHPPTEWGELLLTLNNSTHTAPAVHFKKSHCFATALKSEIYFQRSLEVHGTHCDCHLSKRVTVESKSGNLQSFVQGLWSSVSFFQSLCSQQLWALGSCLGKQHARKN